MLSTFEDIVKAYEVLRAACMRFSAENCYDCPLSDLLDGCCCPCPESAPADWPPMLLHCNKVGIRDAVNYHKIENEVGAGDAVGPMQ